MSTPGKTPTVKAVKCIECNEKIDDFKEAFPLDRLLVHKRCLLKRVEANDIPDYAFIIHIMIYIEDRLKERDLYKLKINKVDMAFSNRQCYYSYAHPKQAIVRPIRSGLFGGKILGGMIRMNYKFVREVYAKKGMEFMIHYIASKVKLLGVKELYHMYNDIDLINKAIKTDEVFPVMFNFTKEPEEIIDLWLSSFCDRHNLLYLTNNHILARFLACDRAIAIKGSKYQEDDGKYRENVIKYLKGEEIETVDIKQQPLLRDVFQSEVKGAESEQNAVNKETKAPETDEQKQGD